MKHDDIAGSAATLPAENCTNRKGGEEVEDENQWSGNDRVFRTYVKGRDDDPKAPDARKIKGVKHILSFLEAEQHDSFGGVLNDGYIDISFDSKEMSECFLAMVKANGWKCLILGDPDRGHYHSYWKNARKRITVAAAADKKLSVGFIADIHGGATYIPLRTKGADRYPPIFDIETGDEYQEVPDELLPVESGADLWGLRDGSGRNEELSRMVKYLIHNSKLGKDQIRRIAANTNKFVFREQLPNKELETILRDETFEDMVTVPELITINGAELSNMNVKPVEFVIDGLIPVGLTVLASPPKYGKSWLCLDMALSVATGRDFLGFRVNQCAVLYLALEDRFDRLKQRAGQILGDNPIPSALNLGIESGTIGNGFIEQMETFLQQHPDVKLLIIDTFVKIRGEPKRNETAYGTDSREAGVIKHFADSHKIAVVLVTHTRKGIDPNDPFVNITGTYGVSGAADDMIVLTKVKRNDQNTKMSVTGRDVKFLEYGLTFNDERGLWVRSDAEWDDFIRDQAIQDARAEYWIGNTRKTVLRLIEENNGCWTGRCGAIIESSKAYKTPIAKTAKQLGDELKVITGFLYEEGVLHTEVPHGSGSKEHRFEKM